MPFVSIRISGTHEGPESGIVADTQSLVSGWEEPAMVQTIEEY